MCTSGFSTVGVFDPCTPEKYYPDLLGHLLPSGVASILRAVSALWRADELLDRTGTDLQLPPPEPRRGGHAHARPTFPSQTRWRAELIASSMAALVSAVTGMAKLMPMLPAPPGEKMAWLMPITSPSMLTSGPPELPKLMAASV